MWKIKITTCIRLIISFDKIWRLKFRLLENEKIIIIFYIYFPKSVALVIFPVQ